VSSPSYQRSTRSFPSTRREHLDVQIVQGGGVLFKALSSPTMAIDRAGGHMARRRRKTPAKVQAEIWPIAEEFLAAEDRLRQAREAVPRSPDEDPMFEGKMAWDLATEVRTAVECVGEDLRKVVESL